ncbi:MAG: transaldolase family protein [Gemmatimonadaceae bacterium]|jgi:transaldolase
MRLYLATVDPDQIRWALQCGLIDGVVATPRVLAEEVPQADPLEILTELAALAPVPIFASVGSLTPTELIRGARALRRVSEQVIVAIPFVEDALPAFRRLSRDGIRCAATFVHSAAQGLLAAKAGAAHVVVPVDALDAIDQPGESVLVPLRTMLDRAALECDLVAAGPTTALRLSAMGAAGADGAVVTPDTLRGLLNHPLTDRAVDRFLVDVARRARPRRAR